MINSWRYFMKKIGKNALILWICAGVCLVGGLGCFATSIGAGICGLVLAAVLGFIGYKQYYKYKDTLIRQEAIRQKRAEQEREEQANQKEHAPLTNYKNKPSNSTQQKRNKMLDTIIVDNETYELKYKYTAVSIAGAGKENYIDAATSVSVGDEITIKAEPSNPYDNKAVALIEQSGSCIGYLHKGRLQDMANDFMRKGLPVLAIAEDSPTTLITLAFYDIEQSKKNLTRLRNWRYDTFRLSANGNEEMQGNIAVCEVGEIVTLEYDYEKSKFQVYNCYSGKIGYINSKKLSYDGEYDACISEISQDEETFKYSISIAIFDLE